VSVSLNYAETVAGPVKIVLGKGKVLALGFIEVLPKIRKSIQMPPILKEAFSARSVGNGSVLQAQGSKFQIEVWNALLKVKFGETCTYGKIAKDIGRPDHVRAVAGAISRNKIAIVVPCHRIIPKSGKVGGYHWGSNTKKALLRHETESNNIECIFIKYFECEKV